MALHTQRKRPPRQAMPEVAARRQEAAELPIHAIGEGGLDSETAYELISSELLLDGRSRLNLATFVTTYMPSVAAQADGRYGRQEHHRQGRVPADR